MLETISNCTGTLVLSKDECGYQDIVDHISVAERVSVVTYNISTSSDGLLKALRTTDAQVRLITNIPGRFESYTSKYARSRASDRINGMFMKLDPNDFGPLATILFCFRNHAKIILTESVAYVGSANYSDESARSWESGIVVRDAQTIALIESWVDRIEADSVRFYGKSMLPAIKPLLLIKPRLERMAGLVSGEFTTDDVEELSEVIEQVSDAVNESDRAWAEAFESCGPLTSRVEMSLVQAIEDWSSSDGVRDLARANDFLLQALEGKIPIDDLATDNDGNIPDSAFDGHIERMSEEQEACLELLKGDIDSVQFQILSLSAQIEAACQDISTHIERIHNAK